MAGPDEPIMAKEESGLTPAEIVRQLDRYIVGQNQAKKAVAVALRNRLRRRWLPVHLREEVLPKNILLIGSTGCGKTEIARRLAKLVRAPFLKVEATKYTEVGYVGRNVESMIRDLTEVSFGETVALERESVLKEAEADVRERLVDALLPGGGGVQEGTRDRLKNRLDAGDLEDRQIEITLRDTAFSGPSVGTSGDWGDPMEGNLKEMLGSWLPPRQTKRKLAIRDARPLMLAEATDARIDSARASREAVRKVQELGILFIDELDKVVPRGGLSQGDVSREGVQRDLLPIVEGSAIKTRHGIVRTDHILFIAAGAFHQAKPSDLIPELQGRFPIRVSLDPLGEEDLYRILTEPENALVAQYKALLETEGVTLDIKDEALRELARSASLINEGMQNIGARRLFTLMEQLLEDVSFRAPEISGQTIVVDRAFVDGRLSRLVRDPDLSRYIL